MPGHTQYRSEEAQELQHINDLVENPSRELARAHSYDLFAKEIARRLRSTMSKLKRSHRHHSRSRSSTTPSASSRLNNSPHGDRRKLHRSPNRKKVPRTPNDQKAPKRGDHSPLRPRGMQQQTKYAEYYPRRIETYHKSDSPIAGYRRVRSPGDVNPSFLQRRSHAIITGCQAFSPDLRAIR